MSFLNDTFTDTSGTLLTAHTGQTGATWTLVSGSAPQIQSDILECAGADTFAVASGTPAGTDYTVTGNIIHQSSPYYGLGGGVVARGANNATTGYVFAWHVDEALWKLRRVVAGSYTTLATDATNAVSFNTPYTITLQVAGSGATVTLTCKVGSTTLFSGGVADTDGARIVAANFAGVYLSTNSSGQGVCIDRVYADDASGITGTLASTESADTAALAGATQTRSVTLTLVDRAAATAASLSSLKWAFYQAMPWTGATPTDVGTTGTTNGSGVFTTSLPNCTLTNGQTGYLVVTNSDGTTSQSPSAKVFAGPAAVAVS